ncbi:hypothetical protein RM780_08790 [Streptomyces sp. DSM 44917]|uniref:DUF4190 domain-containing protein n=1 Tax=Streptomyces boetiae TaxID=3075541 RepID=A0ABU2L776_9ACTN|nr:hypothetical protein [Streptomyces sp. DSM 44917]MDT0307058.1 hypothetical protein [Streptomyces sp. DSM 44917]
MAQATHVTSLLNTDGRPHPRENSLATVTLVLGAVAAIAAVFPGLHLLSSWAGLAGIAIGARAQLISVTTGQRFVTVLGLGAAAVGFYMGVAHGGPFGGWVG